MQYNTGTFVVPRPSCSSKQSHLAMSKLYKIPSRQQVDEYARALMSVSRVKKSGIEVTAKCHYSIGRLHIFMEWVLKQKKVRRQKDLKLSFSENSIAPSLRCCSDSCCFQILANPFEDIIPRTVPTKAEKGGEERKKSTSKATKWVFEINSTLKPC